MPQATQGSGVVKEDWRLSARDLAGIDDQARPPVVFPQSTMA
jgi:predicted Abi (CAAX) family protease